METREFVKRSRLGLVKVPMNRYGAVLTTREAGDRAWREIEREIEAVGENDVVAIDFSGVDAITIPYADACLARLMSGKASGFYESHPLVLTNANDDVRETIGAALNQRHLVALSLAPGGAPSLLGGDRMLDRTIRAAAELEDPFSVGELAKKMELSPQAANNRLRQLTKVGALQRERINPAHGGREFRYSVPVAA
jgi:hypothetical protein